MRSDSSLQNVLGFELLPEHFDFSVLGAPGAMRGQGLSSHDPLDVNLLDFFYDDILTFGANGEALASNAFGDTANAAPDPGPLGSSTLSFDGIGTDNGPLGDGVISIFSSLDAEVTGPGDLF